MGDSEQMAKLDPGTWKEINGVRDKIIAKLKADPELRIPTWRMIIALLAVAGRLAVRAGIRPEVVKGGLEYFMRQEAETPQSGASANVWRKPSETPSGASALASLLPPMSSPASAPAAPSSPVNSTPSPATDSPPTSSDEAAPKSKGEPETDS